MNDGINDQNDVGLVSEEVRPKLGKPKMFKVVLINDDYTPMDFVVEVLKCFFSMNAQQATRIMLDVHSEGKGICGVFTRDIAETKVQQVNQYARMNDYPLLCSMEAA